MTRLHHLCIALAALSLTAVAGAQTVAPSYRPGVAITDANPVASKQRCWTGAAWTDCSGGVRESFQLVAANAPSAPVSVFGGDYVLSQTCAGYGSLTLQVLGPDGATWLTLASYTAADTGSAHGFVLASYARVRVAVSSTTGCNALLSRVPA